jgi:hypothetical protein
MSYFKKAVALLLMSIMVVSLAACGSKTDTNTTKEVEKSPLYQDETKTILIGSWYESYYTSAHTSIYDNPNVDDVDDATMNLENVRTIEQRYNVEFYYKNLTWDGVIESINTSIMANTPDVQIYMVDLQFGLSAVLNNYAYSLEYVLQESPEASLVEDKYKDVLSDEGSDIVKTLSFTSDGLTYLFTANAIDISAYPLGYNKDLIDNYGLEDPYEQYLNGEWTWDTWLADMRAITQDTDGDGATDQWGWRGAWTTMLEQLLMSNGTSIAGLSNIDADGKVVESLSSTATEEVLTFIYNMFQEYKVSFWDSDCDTNWNDNVYAWADGNIGFWLAAPWINAEADKDETFLDKYGMVYWPVGPSGSAETNANINAATGTYYMIPVGVENTGVSPALVFCVMYDYWNWYDNDLTIRDDTTWASEWCYSDQNLDVLIDMADDATDRGMDLWSQISFSEDYQIRGLIETGTDGEPITVEQFVSANKQTVQDYLDKNFNK